MYVATMNHAGYLPNPENVVEVDSAREGWAWLADERARDLDDAGRDDDQTLEWLRDGEKWGSIGTIRGTDPLNESMVLVYEVTYVEA